MITIVNYDRVVLAFLFLIRKIFIIVCILIFFLEIQTHVIARLPWTSVWCWSKVYHRKHFKLPFKKPILSQDNFKYTWIKIISWLIAWHQTVSVLRIALTHWRSYCFQALYTYSILYSERNTHLWKMELF